MLVSYGQLTHSEGFDIGQGRGIDSDRPVALAAGLRRAFVELVAELHERSPDRQPRTPEVDPLERNQFAAPCTGGRCESHWWGGWVSNPRPRDYESPALTTELPPRIQPN